MCVCVCVCVCVLYHEPVGKYPREGKSILEDSLGGYAYSEQHSILIPKKGHKISKLAPLNEALPSIPSAQKYRNVYFFTHVQGITEKAEELIHFSVNSSSHMVQSSLGGLSWDIPPRIHILQDVLCKIIQISQIHVLLGNSGHECRRERYRLAGWYKAHA